ncbi:hypothetical protein MMC07_004805 [Pseudocyphellaria aurata]|nr:hypothetical protein [Pseudocyphellaria aurata]
MHGTVKARLDVNDDTANDYNHSTIARMMYAWLSMNKFVVAPMLAVPYLDDASLSDFELLNRQTKETIPQTFGTVHRGKPVTVDKCPSQVRLAPAINPYYEDPHTKEDSGRSSLNNIQVGSQGSVGSLAASWQSNSGDGYPINQPITIDQLNTNNNEPNQIFGTEQPIIPLAPTFGVPVATDQTQPFPWEQASALNVANYNGGDYTGTNYDELPQSNLGIFKRSIPVKFRA